MLHLTWKILALYTAMLAGAVPAGCQKKNDPPPAPAFVAGADLSYVNLVEASGGVYREGAVAVDPFMALKRQGIGAVRVRLWHNPAWQAGLNGGQRYSDLADALRTMRRARNADMAICLDLHYSDTWADPDHQQTPAAWQGLPLATLADSVAQYTRAVLATLRSQNLLPEMIQVGNETNEGMCWPLGKTTAGFGAFATLLQAGIGAVRAQSPGTQVILHVAQFQHAGPWLQGLLAAGVRDFDIVGVSHYYKWSTVHTMAGVTQAVKDLRTQSGKQVMVVETAFPFTNENADSYNNILYEPSGAADGYPFTIAGQRAYLSDLRRAIVAGGGTGLMVWEPAWITSGLQDGWGTGSSWENNAFFDFSGKLHAGAGFAQD